jgi:hypothetical protein
MDRMPISTLVDRFAEILNEVPLNEAGEPVWELPAYVQDDLAEVDNPLGDAIRGLTHAITHSKA